MTTTNGAVLTAHEATIQTAQIEIQVMKVGKKQVTMGLFRQLPYDILLDPETLQLRGVPWGHVRYWWDGDGDSGGYVQGQKLHVVWQRGEELRRGIVYEVPYGPQVEAHARAVQARMDDWVVLALPQARCFECTGRVARGTVRSREVRLDDETYHVALSDAEMQALTSYWQWGERRVEALVTEGCASWESSDTPEQYAQRRADARAYWHRHAMDVTGGYDAVLKARGLVGSAADEMLQSLRSAQAAQEAYRAGWARQWQVLSALPQLFIAV